MSNAERAARYRERHPERVRDSKKRNYHPIKYKLPDQPSDMTKTCSICNIEKPTSQFTRSTYSKSGYSSKCLSCNRNQSKGWRVSNLDRSRSTSRSYNSRHPEQVAARTRRRRAAKAGVVITVYISSVCCVPTCLLPLVPTAVWPDPNATTIGHEPPLSRAKGLGVTTVIERPEHWVCNSMKHTKLDSELVLVSEQTWPQQPHTP